MAGKTATRRATRPPAKDSRKTQSTRGATSGSATGSISIALKLDVQGLGGLGPGKIRLLEMIEQHGSISAAGRAMPMSYRRAWLMVDGLNRMFAEPIVVGQHGGSRGGGALLTSTGQKLIACYRAIQSKTAGAIGMELKEFAALLKGARA